MCIWQFRQLDCSEYYLQIYCIDPDIDECLDNNGDCDQICTNKPGTHMCECKYGYKRINEGGGHCVDINECALNNGHGPCQDTCINSEGGYACSCEGKRLNFVDYLFALL